MGKTTKFEPYSDGLLLLAPKDIFEHCRGQVVAGGFLFPWFSVSQSTVDLLSAAGVSPGNLGRFFPGLEFCNHALKQKDLPF